jgi:hypothetical protein
MSLTGYLVDKDCFNTSWQLINRSHKLCLGNCGLWHVGKTSTRIVEYACFSRW